MLDRLPKRLPFHPAIALALIALIGFAYVKWFPYYSKALLAESQHFIGDSLVSGKGGAAPSVSWNAAIDYALAYGLSIWKAMVLGLVLGSGIKVLVPARWVSAVLGRLGLRSVFLGGLFAVPCMMCTCCAAPVVAGMRQSRASIGSVVSWWLANPMLNPATLVFMGFVLGWGWAMFRLLFGLATVIGIAYLAERYAGSREADSAGNFVPEIKVSTDGLLLRWGRELLGLSIRLLPEYLILILLLGAARAWLFPAFDAADGITWIVAMAIAGTLFVIPTAGEIPIAQTMLALGMGVGPAAALLITLPAVSLPSLVMLGSVFSLRLRFVIAVAVVVSGIAAGLVAKLVF